VPLRLPSDGAAARITPSAGVSAPGGGGLRGGHASGFRGGALRFPRLGRSDVDHDGAIRVNVVHPVRVGEERRPPAPQTPRGRIIAGKDTLQVFRCSIMGR
jgi:hypothetical protein